MKIVEITLAIILVSLGSMTTLVFAQESISWKSDYLVGILDSEESVIPIKVITFSKNSLQLKWQKPEIKHQEIIGYEILRKGPNSDYQLILETSNPKNTSYVDRNLSEGYYGYKIIPILQKIESNKITAHGINRNNDLFSSYARGQELLAQYTLKQNCIRCSDESFEEIDNIFAYEFPKDDKRTGQDFQSHINSEMSKAAESFHTLFDVRHNY